MYLPVTHPPLCDGLIVTSLSWVQFHHGSWPHHHQQQSYEPQSWKENTPPFRSMMGATSAGCGLEEMSVIGMPQHHSMAGSDRRIGQVNHADDIPIRLELLRSPPQQVDVDNGLLALTFILALLCLHQESCAANEIPPHSDYLNYGVLDGITVSELVKEASRDVDGSCWPLFISIGKNQLVTTVAVGTVTACFKGKYKGSRASE